MPQIHLLHVVPESFRRIDARISIEKEKIINECAVINLFKPRLVSKYKDTPAEVIEGKHVDKLPVTV